MTMRLWIGLWSSFFCVLIVAFDMSSFVRYFTRFTEESFAALVGIIFIFESLKKLYGMSSDYPVHLHYQVSHAAYAEEYCHCIQPDEDIAEAKYQNATQFGKQFDDVFHRTNDSMTTYKDVPWELLTLSECKM